MGIILWGPAWPNDILYIFPVVIFGLITCLFKLVVLEPLNINTKANPFSTPFEILPRRYFLPTLNLLRAISTFYPGRDG